MNFRQLLESDHKYSDNTLEELKLLLKHHKEDLQEPDCTGKCKEETEEDIKEIEDAIKSKK